MSESMNILVACEESQRVCTAFREKGHNAFSCDILPCSGGYPEWHIQGDVLKILNPSCHQVLTTRTGDNDGIKTWQGITFHTMDGELHIIEGKWDMLLAFPPCTYLTVTGNRWFNVDRYGESAIQRMKDREDAINFFMAFANADCDKIAIENPVGVMSTAYRKPNQIIHPYMFGDPERKGTCLWLKGLPELMPTDMVEPNIIAYKNGKGTDSPWHMNTMGLPKEERAKQRSKTFPGIAKAMAEQWG